MLVHMCTDSGLALEKENRTGKCEDKLYKSSSSLRSELRSRAIMTHLNALLLTIFNILGSSDDGVSACCGHCNQSERYIETFTKFCTKIRSTGQPNEYRVNMNLISAKNKQVEGIIAFHVTHYVHSNPHPKS